MAKVIAIGQPVNDSERQAIAHLRDRLPNSYTILHNFEIQQRNEFFEVDLAVIAPHAIYLVDVKGTRGNIDVYGGKWYPERRQPFSSPLPKLRGNAKVLSGLIGDSNHADPDLRKVHVGGAVILTAKDAHLSDSGGKDMLFTTTLAKSVRFFQDSSIVPARRLQNISKYHGACIRAIQGSAKPVTRPPQFGNWVVTEKLGGTDQFTEYRAEHAYVKGAGCVRLRVYATDPYGEDEERARDRALFENAFKALSRLPSHPAVLASRDFFPTEAEDRFVFVVEDTAGQSLRLHIEKPSLALTFDQKTRIARDLLSGLAHVHAHDVIHRDVCPSNILYGSDGQVRLINFDYSRSGTNRTTTIGDQIAGELEAEYQAPECQSEGGGSPKNASAASDVFSAGAVLFELFSGERPYADVSELIGHSALFSVRASQHNRDLPDGFDFWLQTLCTFEKEDRPTAAEALAKFEELVGGTSQSNAIPVPSVSSAAGGASGVDYKALPVNHELDRNMIVQGKLGSGGFGVVYKVLETLGDVSLAVKIILQDKVSIVQRIKIEYQNLLKLPSHPYVVGVRNAGFLPGDGPPYIAFSYVEGVDVSELIASQTLSRNDAWEMGKQVLEGLSHLHRNNVYHCDIKPGNLLWTQSGVKIIDFNVAVDAEKEIEQGGGTRKYLPPDYDFSETPTANDLRDRDLYAFALTLYQALSGKYPWPSASPPRGTHIPDITRVATCNDLPREVYTFLLKAADPQRKNRYVTADEMLAAMKAIKSVRIKPAEETEGTSTWSIPTVIGSAARPNTNPFVDVLLTLYSQGRNNKGTRGLTLEGEVYVETALDRELIPASLDGEFRLVVITGNAGDGKTAFLQKLEKLATDKGATVKPAPRGNGATFDLGGRKFQSNYDGSQDEGDVDNDAVLSEFLADFVGADATSWPTDSVRLIAINEGRLVDFLESHADDYPHLLKLVRIGLETGVPDDGVALVNLNLRSVVADSDDGQASILQRLLKRMTHRKFWKPCQTCDLRDKCYVLYNVKTFQDETAGPQVIDRLKTLYTLTSLRGRLHITLRDLGSSLAYMLAGTRNCDEIHELYASGRPNEIADGFYFNSWMGGEAGSADRLLSLLAEVDVGHATDPRLDRSLDFQTPAQLRGTFGFDHRGNYDSEILTSLQQRLPWEHSGKASTNRITLHRSYVAMARRRHFFERLDDGWRRMLRYQSAGKMLKLVRREVPPETVLEGFIRAINLGEGLTNPDGIPDKMVLQIRDVPNGAMRSYRLFPVERFDLHVEDSANRARFVETMPTTLTLRYQDDNDTVAELDVNLDVFEMLERLNHGYRPTVEELQGYYLSLAIFKNLLSSAPYQEVMLTSNGQEFFRIERRDSGQLRLDRVGAEA